MRRPGAIGVLGLALVASLAANLYLARRAPSPAAAPAPSAPSAAPRAEVPICREATPPRPAAAPDPTAPCEAQLATAVTALAQAEEELERIRSPRDLFERRTTQDPETEARVAAVLTGVFADAPDGVVHDLECRGDVCRLEIVQPAGLHWSQWSEALQSGPSRTQFARMMFTSGAPRQDPISGEALQVEQVHVRVADQRDATSRRLLETLVRTYNDSAEVAACKRDHPTPGWLALRLELAPAARTFQYQAGGDLPSRPGGRCLIAELERRIAELAPQVTPDLPGGVFHLRLEVP